VSSASALSSALTIFSVWSCEPLKATLSRQTAGGLVDRLSMADSQPL
jgi:hypothetical protein